MYAALPIYNLCSHTHTHTHREVNVTLPPSTLRNGTLYGHVFLGPPGRSPLVSTDRPYISTAVVPLTRHAVPLDTTFNLLSGGAAEVHVSVWSHSPSTHTHTHRTGQKRAMCPRPSQSLTGCTGWTCTVYTMTTNLTGLKFLAKSSQSSG